MKYRQLPAFADDWNSLPEAERALVKQWLAERFLPALEAFEADPRGSVWPRNLRFEHLRGTPSVCAVTVATADPEDRVTFEFRTTPDGLQLIWRRLGHHDRD
jgi:hypothetical protein